MWLVRLSAVGLSILVRAQWFKPTQVYLRIKRLSARRAENSRTANGKRLAAPDNPNLGSTKKLYSYSFTARVSLLPEVLIFVGGLAHRNYGLQIIQRRYPSFLLLHHE